MSRTPQPLERFGGLDLSSSPSLIPFERAMDILNVDLSATGSIRSRGGYARFTVATMTNQPDSLGGFVKSDGTKRILVGEGNRVTVLDASGAQIASAVETASPHFFVRFGSPSVEAVYFSNGTDQVQRYDTAGGLTVPAGLAGQTGKFVAVTPTSNRLAVAREAGTTAGNNPSSVNFSNAGAPETFTATNYIDLEPGDGAITGLCTYGDLLFAFKNDKFFVHYSESTDATGNPVFNFRKQETGGAGLSASRALAASPHGVYFLHSSGVYRTTGGLPERVSAPIDAFFGGTTQIYFRSQPLNHGAISAAAMCWHDNKLYVAVPTGGSTTNNRMLVFDPSAGWSLYDLPASALISFPPSSQPELLFARSASSKTVARYPTGAARYAADDMTADGTGGLPIPTRWRSGWTTFGTLSEKQIHDAEFWGTGTVTARVYRNYQNTDSGAQDAFAQELTFTSENSLWNSMIWNQDPWGPSAVITRKTHQKGYPATSLSLDLSDATANNSWQLNLANFLVTGARPPGLKSTD